jgi:TetR/AcrR family transcriptional repressor of nem operon
VATDCVYGCPIGSLALEIHEPDPPVRALMMANFDAWVKAINGCLDSAGAALPRDVDRKALAEFVLTTMEGGVMQARTYRDVGYFDRAVAQLRSYFDRLEREAKAKSKYRKTPAHTDGQTSASNVKALKLKRRS